MPTLRKHFIVWEFEHDTVTARAVCNEPEGADCRLTCPEECESWGDILHDGHGNPYHNVYDADAPDLAGPRHWMAYQSYCNITEFLNDDPTLLPELGSGKFVIGRTDITPVWEGDHYTWEEAD